MSTLALHRPWWRPLPIVALCSTIATVGAFLLYQDYTATSFKGGHKIGVLERVEKSVRRRPPATFLWNSVENGAPLYRKDTIRVGPESTASICLSDGSMLEIGENSLVVLEDVSQLPLSFLQGSFVVRKATGDTLVNVDRSGKARTQIVPVRLLAPAPRALFHSVASKSRTLEMKWQSIKQSDAKSWTALQVSTTKTFTPRRTKEYPLDAAETKKEITLPSGEYYWRLMAQDKPMTEVRAFRIESAAPLQSVSPSSEDKLITWHKVSRIPFRWGTAAASDKIPAILEVSATPGFEKVVFKENVAPTAGSAWLSAVPPGDYYWRLRSVYPEFELMSAPLRFRVQAAEKLPIRLLTPADSASAEKGNNVVFRWRLDGINARYQLELERDGQKVDMGLRRSAAEQLLSSVEWKVQEPATYRWRVVAFYDGAVVGESSWRRLDILEGRPILLTSPQPNQKFEFWRPPAIFDFKWEGESLAANRSFYLDVARDPEFKSVLKTIKTSKATVPSQELGLTDGTWYWRVRLLDGEHPLRVSPTARFQHYAYPLLPAPSNITPAEKHAFQRNHANDHPEATWTPIQDAKHYVVRVRKGGKMVVIEKTEKPSHVFKTLKQGKYEWTVRAVDNGDREGEMLAWRELNILPPKKLRAPQLTVKPK